MIGLHVDILIDYLVAEKKSSTTCFIIGGGPSLKQVLPDPDVLSGKDIIATNNAYKLFPNAFITHFGDACWYHWHTSPPNNLLVDFPGIISTSAQTNRGFWKKNTRVFCFNGGKTKGISTEKNVLYGNNAGHQAINIAILMEYKNIVLIGFDLNLTGDTHWHSEHKRPTNRGNYETTMIPGFNSIAPYQEKLGFKIYNTNKQSNIKCFEFCNLGDWI